MRTSHWDSFNVSLSIVDTGAPPLREARAHRGNSGPGALGDSGAHAHGQSRAAGQGKWEGSRRRGAIGREDSRVVRGTVASCRGGRSIKATGMVASPLVNTPELRERIYAPHTPRSSR